MSGAEERIRKATKEMLSQGPRPLAEILNKIENLGLKRNTASRVLPEMERAKILSKSPVEKGRGVAYSLVESQEETSSPSQGVARPRPEEDFYDSFAKYLLYGDDNRLRECTKAIKLGGGSSARGKWATPDVIGVLKSSEYDPVKFPTEIVSAEIKNDTSLSQLIEGFGQACAYRLFSHKTYLVIPEAGKSERIKTLCHIFGIGLVCFNPAEEPSPSMFAVELLAQRHSPDPFYANEFFDDETLKLKKKLLA